jgi:hypothetical protein
MLDPAVFAGFRGANGWRSSKAGAATVCGQHRPCRPTLNVGLVTGVLFGNTCGGACGESDGDGTKELCSGYGRPDAQVVESGLRVTSGPMVTSPT